MAPAFYLTMSKQAAIAQLKACNAAILEAKSGEAMWFALKGRAEAIRALNAN